MAQQDQRTIPTEERQEQSTPAKELSDYERYCQQLAEAFDDECGDRCFPEMAEGQFIRGH